VAMSPYGGNPNSIPNEDSLDFELDDMNIFSPTPFTGYDRVASGPRYAYGGEYTVTNRGGQSVDVLLGQSYQPHPVQAFQAGTGLDHSLSDYVGRIQIVPSPNLGLNYRFRVNQYDFAMRRSEVDAVIGPKPLNLTVNYAFLGRLNPTSPYDQR